MRAQGIIDWGVLGPSSSEVSNPFIIAVPGIPSMSVAVAMSQGDFVRLDQGTGWFGSFGRGEKLLFTDLQSIPIVFNFSRGIHGFGAQVEDNLIGPFTAVMTAFGASGELLGTFMREGVGSTLGDDSALFVGLRSSDPIFRIEFNSTPPNEEEASGFAINGPLVESAPIPEPTTLMLLGGGLIGAVIKRKRGGRCLRS
jgi:hypothetical protein